MVKRTRLSAAIETPTAPALLDRPAVLSCTCVTATPTRAITRIRVQGYRSLRDVTLEPGRVTVLIGPNSAGKSNLLSFLQMVAVLLDGGLSHFIAERGGASVVLHYGPKTTSEISFRFALQA